MPYGVSFLLLSGIPAEAWRESSQVCLLIYGNYSESTSKTLRVSSVWRIRQIDLYKKVLMNASIQRPFLTNLLGSEQLHFTILRGFLQEGVHCYFYGGLV